MAPVDRAENLEPKLHMAGGPLRTVWKCVMAGSPVLVKGEAAKQVQGDVLVGMDGACLRLAPGKVGWYCLPMGVDKEAGLLEMRGLQSLAVSSHSLAMMGAVHMG